MRITRLFIGSVLNLSFGQVGEQSTAQSGGPVQEMTGAYSSALDTFVVLLCAPCRQIRTKFP